MLENSVTGERIVFRRTASETGGELLEFDDYWARGGQRTPEHVHPEMEERWQVISGTARFRIAGVEQAASAGDVVIAAPGTPHVGWNDGEGEVHVRVQMRPALRWEEFVRRLFALASAGKTDAQGVPDGESLAALMSEFRREIAPPSHPPADGRVSRQALEGRRPRG